MPDLVTHHYFGSCVYDALPAEIQSILRRSIYDHCCAGPDVWFSIGFLGGKYKKFADRGSVMQAEHCGDFLCALAEECKTAGDKSALFSYLAGFLCHYCLDSLCHPYIISKTGNCESEEEILLYRGNHTRLERAIDSHIIRSKYGYIPWHFPFRKKILRLNRLPQSIQPPLERVYARVYGWQEVFPLLQRCIRDQRRFYALAKDPTGLLTRLLHRADSGRGEQPKDGLSFYHKDIDPADIDYMNEKKLPWRHYRDPDLISESSFPELFRKAQEDCTAMISACFRYIFADGPHPAPVLENRSYESGFDCRDPRNTVPGHYECIF